MYSNGAWKKRIFTWDMFWSYDRRIKLGIMNLCVVVSVKMMRHNEVAEYNMGRQAGSLGPLHVGQDDALVFGAKCAT